MEPWTRHQKTQWQLIRQVAFSKDAEQHRRCMALLLLQLHKINQKQFTRRCRQLYKLDPILGPQAVAWGLRTMGEITPAGKERRFYLTEADKALDDAAIMKKLPRDGVGLENILGGLCMGNQKSKWQGTTAILF